VPRSVSEAGSGVAATLLRLIVRLKLHGAPTVHPVPEVISYKSVTENRPTSFNDVAVAGPNVPMAVNMFELNAPGGAAENVLFAGSLNVLSVTVKPPPPAVPGLTLKELR
jgi:hypothetical protein